MSSKTTDELDTMCSVCNDHTEIYAIGACDHKICYKCSTRMRVLCEQTYCAICRGELPKVVFTSKPHKFGAVVTHHFPTNRKHKIFFENSSIQEKFYRLQEQKCKLCPDHNGFNHFNQYKDHMRKEHSLFACDLCSKYIKLFSCEVKFYDRVKLAEHRRIGDKDDRSHKGHPNCNFCDVRYFDKDELYKHLRKEHYFCHFCEADGFNECFPDHDAMAEHFRHDHFLCEEGPCQHEKFFTNAFRTEIDYKAHCNKTHSKGMSKAAARATRTVDIDFTYAPRESAYRGGGGRGGRDRDRDRGVVRREDYDDVQRDERRGRGGGRGGRGGGGYDRRRQQREDEDAQRAIDMRHNIEQARQGNLSVLNPNIVIPEHLREEAERQRNPQAFKPKDEEDKELDTYTFSSGGNSRNHSGGSSPTPMSDNQQRDGDRDTLAKQVARANNMSVGGSMRGEEDFPALGGGGQNRGGASFGSRWTGPSRNSEDFPSLQQAIGGSGGNSPANQSPLLARSNWTQQQQQQQSRGGGKSYTKFSTPSIQSTSDFPSLSSIGNILLKPNKQPQAQAQAQAQSKKQQGPPPAQQQPLSRSSNTQNNTQGAKPKTGWQTVGNSEPEPAPKSKGKKSKQNKQQRQPSPPRRTTTPPEDDFPSLGRPAPAVAAAVGRPAPAAAAAPQRTAAALEEDFPSLGKPAAAAHVPSSASLLFGSKSKGSKPSAGKGRIVGVIPAKKPAEASANESKPKPKGEEWRKVAGGGTTTTAMNVESESEWQVAGNGNGAKTFESEKPAIEIVCKPNAKEKNKKKKEQRPSNATKSEDFPALGAGAGSAAKASGSGSAARASHSAGSMPVGSTWISDEVKKTIEQGDEWKEIPKSKPMQQTSNKKKNKRGGSKTPPVVLDDDEDFPSLGGNASMPQGSNKKNKKGWSAPAALDDDDDFPSLGGRTPKATATWLAKEEPKAKANAKKEEEKDSGLVKMKVKGKKKGKKSPDNDDETKDAESTNGVDHSEVEKLIEQMKIASGKQDSQASSNKKNKGDKQAKGDSESINKENTLNAFPDFYSQPPALDDDFPSLTSKATTKAPPPGFSSSTKPPSPPPGIKKPPPPGFQSAAAPPGMRAPPGFGMSVNPISNGNGRSSSSDYINPPNSEARNGNLVVNINTLLDNDAEKLVLFYQLSGDFRRGVIGASTYFSRCCDLFTTGKFASICPELMVLLPDIQKQTQLLQAYRKAQLKGVNKQNFTSCSHCEQVTYTYDAMEHAKAHQDANDFPALGGDSPPMTLANVFNKGKWGK